MKPTSLKPNLFAGALGVLGLLALRGWLRQSRYLDLRGRVVFITGGSRGLGLALAREFAARGARVAICARGQSELLRVREEFGAGNRDFLALACDVRANDQVQETVATIEENFGPIDVLVNNAGIIVVGPENQTLEIFQDTLQTNFWGPLYAALAVKDRMKRRAYGRIVNIASIGGKLPAPHLLPYTASKFALVGFSEGLRAELAKDNILVTTVCPGLMRTGSPRNADFLGQAEKEYTWFAVSGSLPGLSINVERAARQIVDACVHGEAEVHLGATSKLGALFHGMVPGLSAELFAKINQLLPGAVEPRATPQKGFQSETPTTQSSVTKLTRLAEVSHNQL